MLNMKKLAIPTTAGNVRIEDVLKNISTNRRKKNKPKKKLKGVYYYGKQK